MTRPSPLAALLLAVAALAAAGALVAAPAAAHGNHAAVDPQVSANGTVLVETAYVSSDAWLVVHRDDGGSPGEPVGRTRLAPGVLHSDVAVTVDGAAWRDWLNGTAWVVLHRNQGADGFDPAEDPVMSSFGSTAGQQFPLAKGDRAVVAAAGFSPQRSGGNVTVRRAALSADGYLVLHNGSLDGPVVGRVALSAGEHRNVSVSLNESFYTNNDRATLVAALYADDGDGAFGPGDRPVRAGDAPVATDFATYLRGAGNATATESLVTTATPGGDGASGAAGGASTPTPTDGGGPGFGAAAAFAALLVGLGLLAKSAR